MNKHDLLSSIDADWYANPVVGRICRKIADYILSMSPNERNHITFSSFVRISENNNIEEIMLAIVYLSSAATGLLEWKWEYEDTETGRFEEVDIATYNEARTLPESFINTFAKNHADLA